ncbi:MAG: orotidine-5'-phosphate decarboxylase [Aminobacterium sp.]|jgi:orotidine-5'-phosphate decarboxylase|uniref:orotidine-5'-phosphate decarboxylase n=1 Tax=Aminobacterium sp. MB27-C1 TaxID=3070661 RepID=UPI001BCA7D9E|nr:orotidine-5'-phosphate decarboxylase [Aminobacterium sp. MB27-C1]MDD2205989.1 orotidine-5'-phosphate decarboxylase [Aminobacterium sp.]MDD3426952.1 orotidine-5'-phosphate decarboxylase [Aminobacterium sp.]MDD3707166.1 orotidine-5'-phosphate decarboxylase [Aminobacterium sp.]MDD4227854.1 orotidine-5'-phosphate decarboxylase [Aminobacterium sp.]MDD4550706.1 orotidine-5'-phosphate decarboxylase [Aminobacterium sp.]
MINEAQNKLILALDVENLTECRQLLSELQGELKHVKIGHQLYAKGGIPFLKEIMTMDYKVFLDLKLHDIPNTVRMAVEALAGEGIWALTLHGAGGRAMLEDAKAGRDKVGGEMNLLGVTVLTSMNNELWEEVTPGCAMSDALKARATVCADAEIDGLVCSPLDLPIINETKGKNLIKVVPGIRPSAGGDDQARTANPKGAIMAGADFLVVGRPILKAPDRLAALHTIVNEIKEGLQWKED